VQFDGSIVVVTEPHYPKAGKRGRQPTPRETMLRIYIMPQWYAMSAPAAEDALHEIDSMRRFVGLDLTNGLVYAKLAPDMGVSTILCNWIYRMTLSSNMMTN
jgi:hypothetical protein